MYNWKLDMVVKLVKENFFFGIQIVFDNGFMCFYYLYFMMCCGDIVQLVIMYI